MKARADRGVILILIRMNSNEGISSGPDSEMKLDPLLWQDKALNTNLGRRGNTITPNREVVNIEKDLDAIY